MNEHEFDRLLEHVINEDVSPSETLLSNTRQVIKKPLNSAFSLAGIILLSCIVFAVTAFITFPEHRNVFSLLAWFSGVTILMNGLTAVILIRLAPLTDFFITFENTFYQD